jgi:maleate isomerase
MKHFVRLGMLTPSSNTVLEPFTMAMLAGVPEVTAHFSRFKVTEIALSDDSLSQFEFTDILRAAELLAHAKVDVIAWNGTSASWLGFERDELLCEGIFRATGIPACTSILAFREIFDRTGAREIGLVTPYRDDVQAKIVTNWSRSGYVCRAERHIGLQDNYSFSEINEQTIAGLVREVVREGCEAVAIVCTNMRGTRVAPRLEEELGIPVYDSIATTLWKSLQIAGVECDCIQGWGSLFTKLKGVIPIATTDRQTKQARDE